MMSMHIFFINLRLIGFDLLKPFIRPFTLTERTIIERMTLFSSTIVAYFKRFSEGLI